MPGWHAEGGDLSGPAGPAGGLASCAGRRRALQPPRQRLLRCSGRPPRGSSSNRRSAKATPPLSLWVLCLGCWPGWWRCACLHASSSQNRCSRGRRVAPSHPPLPPCSSKTNALQRSASASRSSAHGGEVMRATLRLCPLLLALPWCTATRRAWPSPHAQRHHLPPCRWRSSCGCQTRLPTRPLKS